MFRRKTPLPTSSKHEDVEFQRVYTARSMASTNEDHAIRSAAMQQTFASSDVLRAWPGVRGYCQYLERSFEPLLGDEFECIWTVAGVQRPKRLVDCWSWFNAVNNTIRSMEERNTITDVLDEMKRSLVNTQLNSTISIDTNTCLIATFAVLCWSSMTLQPMLSVPDSGTPALWARRLSPLQQMSLKLDTARRPIVAAFRNFQRNQGDGRWRQPICDNTVGQSSVLHVSTLTFHSLQTIGKIRLNWVDELSSHLDFESRTRTLSVFRFPSFCALTATSESRGVVIEG